MSAGLLLITHGDIGKSVYETAVAVIGSSPLRTEIISVEFNQGPDQIVQQLHDVIKQLDTGDGVLILTDMYGATPSNVACRISDMNISIVAGLNLPMLIRVMNYPTLSLAELVEKAISGGQEGIIYCRLAREKHVAQGS